jgi:uncharacterized protein (DUF1778 family)
MSKRTTTVTVKMTAEDYAFLSKAADHIWPKAILTRSSIVLGLARIGAESVLGAKERARKT